MKPKPGEPEWMTTAREKGLTISSTSVRAAALTTPGTGATCAGTRPETVLDGCSEADFQELVVGLATREGWRVAHCRKVLVKQGKSFHWETTMPKGWPDLVLVRPPALLFVELKADNGYRSAEQKEWAQDLLGCGTHYHLWRPRDWSEIVKTLSKET